MECVVRRLLDDVSKSKTTETSEESLFKFFSDHSARSEDGLIRHRCVNGITHAFRFGWKKKKKKKIITRIGRLSFVLVALQVQHIIREKIKNCIPRARIIIILSSYERIYNRIEFAAATEQQENRLWNVYTHTHTRNYVTATHLTRYASEDTNYGGGLYLNIFF